MEPTSSIRKLVTWGHLLVAQEHLLLALEHLLDIWEHLVMQEHPLAVQEHQFSLVVITHMNRKQSKLPTRNMRYTNLTNPSYHTLTKFTEFHLTATAG